MATAFGGYRAPKRTATTLETRSGRCAESMQDKRRVTLPHSSDRVQINTRYPGPSRTVACLSAPRLEASMGAGLINPLPTSKIEKEGSLLSIQHKWQSSLPAATCDGLGEPMDGRPRRQQALIELAIGPDSSVQEDTVTLTLKEFKMVIAAMRWQEKPVPLFKVTGLLDRLQTT